jgi:hypothetical protein
MPILTVEDAAYDHVRDMEASASYEEAAKIRGIQDGFIAGAAWQKEQDAELLATLKQIRGLTCGSNEFIYHMANQTIENHKI